MISLSGRPSRTLSRRQTVFLSFIIAVLLTFAVVFSSQAEAAAPMDNYCAVPPFIASGGVPPNVLLTLDNSASMYDLNYVDGGNATRDPQFCYDQTYDTTKPYVGYFHNKVCSVTTTTPCEVNEDCPGGETCETALYEFLGACSGNNSVTCKTDAECENTNQGSCIEFQYATAGFPPSADCEHERPGVFCVDFELKEGKETLDQFVATGHFMNWLTSSKFDVQKKILTGGKYSVDTSELIAETRGCVGRRFIKEPNLADYVDFNDGEPNPNVSAGVTFTINGPRHSVNPAAPSPGGETLIEFFEGDFNQEACQAAVDAFEEGHDPASIKKAVDDCLSFSPAGSTCAIAVDPITGDPFPCSNSNQCRAQSGDNKDECIKANQTIESKRKVVFQQSIQACWQYLRWLAGEGGRDISTDDANTVENQCTDVYPGGTCSDGFTSCKNDNDCVDPHTCGFGPNAILPGNPALLCSTAYAGYCYAGSAPNWLDSWQAMEYLDADECIKAKHRQFCGDLDIPPVIDPTDDPSDTSLYDNLPAIISDIGIEGQLGEPIARLNVNVYTTNEPEGVIQRFSQNIRFGAMSFNQQGSPTECPLDDKVYCPKKCSNNIDLPCASHADCPGYDPFDAGTWNCTDVLLLPNVKNADGGQIIHYIGADGKCSVNTATVCNEDVDCPDFLMGETCNTVGDHAMGSCKNDPAKECDRDIECQTGIDDACITTLINRIDGLRAETWTPFSEGLYTATGYFARSADHTFPFTPANSVDRMLNDGTDGFPADYEMDRNPSQYRCQTNNVLLITDGLPTTDLNPEVAGHVALHHDPADNEQDVVAGVCPEYSGSRNLDDVAWMGQNRDIRDLTTPMSPTFNEAYRSMFTHVVFNGVATDAPGECNPRQLLEETARNGGGQFVEAHTPQEVEAGILNILTQLSGEAASGTAASVLATGADKGANLLQAVFYPSRTFYLDVTDPDRWKRTWVGLFRNFWYYIDPRFGATSIREDSDKDNTLHLKNDAVVFFEFKPNEQKTYINLYHDVNGDFSVLTHDPATDVVPFEGASSLWEAGELLWRRDLSTAPRVIRTSTDGLNLTDFSPANRVTLRPYLQAVTDDESEAIIRYAHGEDGSCSGSGTLCSTDADCDTVAGETCTIGLYSGSFRTRTAPIDFNGDGDFTDPGEEPKVWKLGDIVNATPAIHAGLPLGNYYSVYGDETYQKFTQTADYTERGEVFVGSNSGMFHAFKLGRLQTRWNGQSRQFEFARMINPDTDSVCNPADAVPCGSEIWSYIPRNVLPYVRYDMETGYCHTYLVDGMPILFDASINGAATDDKTPASWKTIIIGSMRQGGACSASDSACTDCVKAPGVDLNGNALIDTDAERKLGLSSYFALDITDPDPANWDLLWEFTHEDLGFSTTGPTIVKISPKKGDGNGDGRLDFRDAEDNSKNGYWYIMLTSGPTGPIDQATRQFMGRSDRPLKLFVLDLRTGALVETIDQFNKNGALNPINDAFGGSSISATVDPDVDYQDDALYLTYTKKIVGGVGNSYHNGGIIRILTNEDQNPANWKASLLMDNIGSVSASAGRLKNIVTEDLWVYFGTGRYFFKQGNITDDPLNIRRLHGIKDPCFLDGEYLAFDAGQFNAKCNAAVSLADLQDVTLLPNAVEDDEGWYIDLEAQNVPLNGFDAERVITNPAVSGSLEAVFFTTFKPSADVCSFGGLSHVWALQYDTGGTAQNLRGKALLQVSTGSVEQIDLKDAFQENDPNSPGYDPDRPDNPDSKGDRRTGAFTGKPPEGPGLILLAAPPPYGNIIHTMER